MVDGALAALTPRDTNHGLRLSASRRLGLADYFAVPYGVAAGVDGRATEQLRGPGGAALHWCRDLSAAQSVTAAWIEDGGERRIPIFGRILPDSAVMRLLADLEGQWSPAVAVRGQDGRRLGAIWTDGAGSWLLPFSPDEIVENYRSERYLELVGSRSRARVRHGLMQGYYRVRGVLPRAAQIWLRRGYSHLQARTPFPRWPVETGLHDFYSLVLSLIASAAGGAVPHLGVWPRGHTWALVLTHDVESAAGLESIRPILELERSLGVRSCWNFVPERYAVDEGLVRELLGDGFEVGVHGLRHDGRDLHSQAELQRRLPAMRSAARRWGAKGFRSPSMHRSWDLMPRLGFEYDASWPDSDPFEPQRGGCCTWLPFLNQDMVELPLTMVQDHTLFVILGQRDESLWVEKAEFLRASGGMAQILTHPDYLVDARMMDAYRRLLERFVPDESAWKALPGEVSAWWRRRAASTIRAGDGAWAVHGPAAGEAEVKLVSPERP